MALTPETMGFAALKEWLADRLRLRGPAAADIDQRAGETPYDKPLARWQAGREGFRRTFVRAVRQILREIRPEEWDVEGIHCLMVLIEEGEMVEVGKELTDIAYTHAWAQGNDGVQRHMLALRGLLGIGSRQTPQFWLDERERLGGPYPELVFRGLAAHGLEVAFDHLWELATDVEAAKRIAGLFPRLIEDAGQERVRKLATGAMQCCLTPAVADYLNEWFPDREFGPALRQAATPERTSASAWRLSEVFRAAGMVRSPGQADPGWAGPTTRAGGRLLTELVVLPTNQNGASLVSAMAQ